VDEQELHPSVEDDHLSVRDVNPFSDVNQRATIDRIVIELAEAESWESLAQRAGRHLRAAA
jgi:hypothetical protein